MKRMAQLIFVALFIAGTASLANAQGYGPYGGNSGTSFGIRLGGLGISYNSPRNLSYGPSYGPALHGKYRSGYGDYGRGVSSYGRRPKHRKSVAVPVVRRGYQLDYVSPRVIRRGF